MQFSIAMIAAALAGSAAAFTGQMAASAYEQNEGGTYQIITLTDYNSGSKYSGTLSGGFNACTTEACTVYFREITTGGYNFNSIMWRTSDGCHNIDFEGALDAGHGYCCGSPPCDFSA